MDTLQERDIFIDYELFGNYYVLSICARTEHQLHDYDLALNTQNSRTIGRLISSRSHLSQCPDNLDLLFLNKPSTGSPESAFYSCC